MQLIKMEFYFGGRFNGLKNQNTKFIKKPSQEITI